MTSIAGVDVRVIGTITDYLHASPSADAAAAAPAAPARNDESANTASLLRPTSMPTALAAAGAQEAIMLGRLISKLAGKTPGPPPGECGDQPGR